MLIENLGADKSAHYTEGCAVTGQKTKQTLKTSPEKHFEQQLQGSGFVPDLCTARSVFTLVLVGELLTIALVLAKGGIARFDWLSFGSVSFLTQWIVLSSAALLCPLRRSFDRMRLVSIVTIFFVVVLTFTLFYSLIGIVIIAGWGAVDVQQVAANSIIAAIFAGVLLRYLYLQHQLKLREAAELNSRIQALQSRIRPHFLFNSLNSVASLITIDPEVAEKLVLNLSQLFRASLKSPQMVPIQQEIDLCRSFADIEKVRLGKRLNVIWTVGDLPKQCQILNLLMQPLLENAIYHGIQPLPDGGKVSIDIRQIKGDIVIKIVNPRLPGGPRRSDLCSEDGGSGNGIALGNIRRRLEAYYATKAYLRVVKGEADFTVLVRYPA